MCSVASFHCIRACCSTARRRRARERKRRKKEKKNSVSNALYACAYTIDRNITRNSGKKTNKTRKYRDTHVKRTKERRKKKGPARVCVCKSLSESASNQEMFNFPTRQQINSALYNTRTPPRGRRVL